MSPTIDSAPSAVNPDHKTLLQLAVVVAVLIGVTALLVVAAVTVS